MLLNSRKTWKKKNTNISLKTGIPPPIGRAKNGAVTDCAIRETVLDKLDCTDLHNNQKHTVTTKYIRYAKSLSLALEEAKDTP
jgi:hypothetical protein